MASVLFGLQVAMSGLLLVAAVGKLLRLEEFAAALRLSHLPAPLVGPATAAVPVLELALAFGLLLAPAGTVRAVWAATAALLALFTLWMALIRARRLRVRCGCFGGGGGEVGGRTIARNVGLLLLAAAGFALAGTTGSLVAGPSLPLLVASSSAGMALALLLALRTARPNLILSYDDLRARVASDDGR